jgi:predicted XRE-type DNA-binding protein
MAKQSTFSLPDGDRFLASSNIFEDLGFNPQEAENLRLRSELMQKITTFIETQNLTIDQAAHHLAETSETIAALQNGKIGEFPIDRLISMLNRAGMTVRIDVFPAAA